MKYEEIEFKYAFAELIKSQDLKNLCRKFGISSNRLLNSIKAKEDSRRLKHKDWEKLAKTPPGFDKEQRR